MPEYLAPDVYVEEIDTGSKPIEGVSTSTAGMLGVTERGPANVPILVTSNGEYARWFGGLLDPLMFVNPAKPLDLHCFLPHAVDGFFTNGGKRLYVTRVEAAGAAHALFDLHDRDSGKPDSAFTWLLRPAPELSGDTPATAAYVVSIDTPAAGALADGNHVRVGRGSETEYRDVGPGVPPPPAVGIVATPDHVALDFPLRHAHTPPTTVHEIVRVTAGPGAMPLHAAVAPGTSVIEVEIPAALSIAGGQLLEIGADPQAAEYRFVVGTPLETTVGPLIIARVVLDAPLLLPHEGAITDVTRINPSPGGGAEIANTTIDAGHPTGIGDSVLHLAVIGANFTDPTHLVVLDRAAPIPADGIGPHEVRRIGRLAQIALAFGAHDTYDAGSSVAVVGRVAVGAPRALTTAVPAGTLVVALDNRSGIVENTGMLLQVGGAPPFEYAVIGGVPNRAPGGVAPDPGQVQLAQPLQRAYPVSTPALLLQAPVADPTRPASSVALAAAARATQLVVTDAGDLGSLYKANQILRVTAPNGTSRYHDLATDAAHANAHPVVFTVPFARPHAAGSPLAERRPLLRVQALDTGSWGNRLRVSVADESPGLVARMSVTHAIAPTRIRLASPAGVEAGTVLELVDGAGVLVAMLKVQSVSRATAEVTLDATAALSGPQVAAVNAPGAGFAVRSREFSLTVRLFTPPDPSAPSTAETELAREVFRNLSLDPRHSRYVQTVIGDILGAKRLSDHRSDGESWYVRVHDVAQDLPDGPPAAGPFRLDELHRVRVGPEPLTDLLTDGREVPARHPLDGGDDAMGTLTDAAYVGTDNVDPEARTGLYALNNVEDVSIVAVPGRTSAVMQGALIAHCELARYRFAVLDAQRPPRDTIADVISQRQQFDTKYAAIYHPWLLIPPPFPASASMPDEYPIPPAGHVVGVYARTDVERGVHKAPANEIVRGVTGLQRLLNKSEHDVLNPYPINVNVIRDFRPNARGIRVYGGRVITSDSDWKYVNVRRLLIFIEASINRGLQWVVFEPNAEPLWARVRRSITNFLTLVWRNGALEGTKVEEAFFVKCDRTTMTQTDIDSGRLICVVGVAPVKPAEFVIVRIGLWTAHADD